MGNKGKNRLHIFKKIIKNNKKTKRFIIEKR